MSETKTIAVVGAAGATSGGLARAILADSSGGYACRAITRTPDSAAARALADQGATVVRADLDDAQLTRIFFLQLSVIGSTMGTRPELDALVRFLDATGARPLVDRAIPMQDARDGFAAMAFASTFGIGVLFSAASVAVVQGLLTVLGMGLGEFLPEAQIAALTATGGVMLAGIGLRLLRIRDIPVADMLPALLVAPLLTTLVVGLR